MSGRFTRSWSEAGAQTPPLLRASSPLKPKNQPRTNIETGTANGGTSLSALARKRIADAQRARWAKFKAKKGAWQAAVVEIEDELTKLVLFLCRWGLSWCSCAFFAEFEAHICSTLSVTPKRRMESVGLVP